MNLLSPPHGKDGNKDAWSADFLAPRWIMLMEKNSFKFFSLFLVPLLVWKLFYCFLFWERTSLCSPECFQFVILSSQLPEHRVCLEYKALCLDSLTPLWEVLLLLSIVLNREQRRNEVNGALPRRGNPSFPTAALRTETDTATTGHRLSSVASGQTGFSISNS